MFVLTYTSLKELPFVAGMLVRMAGPARVWLLEGEMGAGKTTLVKAVCSRLGVADTVQSPTYALANEYRTAAGEPCYHFDFYRIRHEAEAADMGVEEYFESGHYCFVEWAEKIPHLLPAHYLKITFTLEEPNKRILHVEAHSARI